MLFSRVSPLIKMARSKVIQLEDLMPLPEYLLPWNHKRLKSEDLMKTEFQFLLTSLRIFPEYSRRGYLYLFGAMTCSLLTPNLVNIFIKQLESDSSLEHKLLTGLALAIGGSLTGVFFQYYFFCSLRNTQSVVSELNRLIFEKSLKLSNQARSKSQVGDIVNHMSSDTDVISEFMIIYGDLWYSATTILLASAMMFYYIGLAAIPALLVLIALVPVTKRIAKNFTKYESAMMDNRDRRITLISQILQSIRVVKYFAWEKAVNTEVNTIRDQELNSRRQLARAEVFASVSYVGVSSLVLFVALFSYAWFGNPLTPAIVFTCISLFSLLEEPMGNLSRVFSGLTQALVSSKRIREFLSLEEAPGQKEFLKPLDPSMALEFDKAEIYQDLDRSPVLSDLRTSIRQGESIAIVGGVGSGKTSFLYSILGECHVSKGQIRIASNLNISYVPQEAYVINATLLENIRFGSEHHDSLRKALHASCLDKDIRILPAGLKTEIGEKGVNLSGGQKQRVSLARAYLQSTHSEHSLVLLDDPLSAVDVETERQICDRLIFGLWKNSTRIIVTHRLDNLYRFDRVIFLKNGKIEVEGPYFEILKNSSFQDFLSGYKMAHHEIKIDSEISEKTIESEESRITEDEEREKGAVKSHIYWDYIVSLGGNGPYRILILAALFLGALIASGLPLIQRWWITNYQTYFSSLSTTQAILIYGFIGVMVLLAGLSSQLLWLDRGIRAGKHLHQKMLDSILGSPIRFFDSTPIGRILQRFSRDIESVDIHLQWCFDNFVRILMQVLVSLVLVLGVMPMMILVMIPCLLIYYRLQLDYRRPAREVKRMDSVARSPRYAHFKETLLGLVPIRAFKKQDWFLEQFYQKLSFSHQMFFNHYMINRWFSVRVPLVASLISLTTVFCVAVLVQLNSLSPALAGLVTIYSLSFWWQMNWGIRVFSDIESRMTSVERLRFYGSLPSEQEPDLEVAAENWPTHGHLKIHNVKARYASHLPWVLNGLDFEVKPGEKVGIVGRTGSGKTTLFQILYRFVDYEEGSIYFDGKDIKSIPLEQLRKSLAIVPQDPSLFLGTLRSNLDRYHEHTDDQIWKVLDQTGLSTFAHQSQEGLAMSIHENGSNLSQGQRQLMCLARALLMKAKIILMDEATASVDVQTDFLIQQVIRNHFKQVTMLIIAHRLETIKDCDQIIQMSDGRRI